METAKHECGIALVRLLKPLHYYKEKYGSWQYGLGKLYLLMEKQRNRGQEGAGIACVNVSSPPGSEYIFRDRSLGNSAINELFGRISDALSLFPASKTEDPEWAACYLPYAGQSLMGHLRYSTTGRTGIAHVHPFLRRSNWKSRSLLMCGNFHLTNVDEIFQTVVAEGQHPRMLSDTFLMLEALGKALDRHVQKIYDQHGAKAENGLEMNDIIADHMDIGHILRISSARWDGGYVVCGLTGNSNLFAFRDPWGIRSAFYYYDDEIAVVASERPVIQTALNVGADLVRELLPGEAFIINHKNEITLTPIHPPAPKIAPCSFERIYFSRGSDRDIYQERKTLGRQLVRPILKTIGEDLENTVFSFIPNTAEVAFFGMMEGFEEYLTQKKKEIIRRGVSGEELERVLSMRIRQEKVAIKDVKLRTFISGDKSRNDLAAHVYDITYGSLREYEDNLVVIDDSIVRGTTLKQSIIKILDRLNPKKIVIVSSSPQVRYPDYYGIDMSSMNEFVAFRAAVALLKERGMTAVIDEVYQKCKAQENYPKERIENNVKAIYAPFSAGELSGKIADLLKPADTKAAIEIVYQTMEGLRAACPSHGGDWYFTGDYPTPGGNMCVNRAFIHYYETGRG